MHTQMRWYSKKNVIPTVKHFKTKVEKAKSKNQIFNNEKIQKAYKNQKLSSPQKNYKCFGHKTSEPIGFHDNDVIITRIFFYFFFFIFFGFELTLRW